MEWSVVSLLGLAAVAWLWYDSMRARERAVAAGQSACARERLQFLDETVECTSVKPVRNAGRLVLRRAYRFEFSDDGSRRRAGSIVMLSGEVESLTMEPFLLQ